MDGHFAGSLFWPAFILATSATLRLGDTFTIIAPFTPIPLHAVLRRRDFRAECSSADGGGTQVRFTQTGIAPATALAEAAERASGRLDVLNRHGMESSCGGSKTLTFAAKAHRVPLEALLEELHTARNVAPADQTRAEQDEACDPARSAGRRDCLRSRMGRASDP